MQLLARPIYLVEDFEVDPTRMCVRRAGEEYPHYQFAHYHLGQAYQHQGHREQARTAYQRFLEVWKGADPDLPEIIQAKAYLKD